MATRQPPPRLWLMTDERLGDRLFGAIARLPAGAGIVFRHYSRPEPERRALFDRVKSVAGQRGIMLLLAGPAEQAHAWGADGSHGRGPGAGFRSAPVHDLAEIRVAEAAGADLIFLSPVFATASHPDARLLGVAGFAELAAATAIPAIALGGMNAERFRQLSGAHGWAAIRAWAD